MESLVDSFSEKVFQLRSLMRRQYVTNHGKGIGMVLVKLSRMTKGESITITQVSQEFGFTLAAATQMVKMLVKHGFLKRLKDASDARVIRIQLTPKGEEVAHQVHAHAHKFVEGLIHHLGTSDAETLDRILGSVLTFVSQLDIREEGNLI